MKEKRQEAAVTIGSVEELQALVDKPVNAEFRIAGQEVRVPCTAMTAATAEMVRAIRRGVQPRFDKQRNDYDVMSSDYLAKKDAAERQVRGVIIYRHCPAVAKKQPGLMKPEEIAQFVNGLFTENVLELLSLTIQQGALQIEDRVNFISPPALES